MKILVIAGHYSPGINDSLHHVDDYRLTIDNVLMSLPNLVQYIRNGCHLPPKQIEDMRRYAQQRPYQQIYWNGLHLYDFLTKNGYDSDLLNLHCPNDPWCKKLFSQQPDVVVVSTTFMNLESIRCVVADVRANIPNAKIIVGGIYVRYSYLVYGRRAERHYNHPDVLNRYLFTCEALVPADVFIYDQSGEQTLLQVLRQFNEGGSLDQVPNLIVPDGYGSFSINSAEPEKYDMDRMAIDWRSVDARNLASVVPIQNTYGCPFRCNFCNFSTAGISIKSMDVLFDELHSLAETHAVERVWFTDDNFFLNEKRVLNFCERYIAEDLPFSWSSFIRANSVTAKTIDVLAKSKCNMLMVGFESGSPGMLKNMNKGDTVEHYREAATLLIENGIDMDMSFIVGFPGETESTIAETEEFLSSLPTNEHQRNYLYLFKFNVLPLAPVFEEKMRKEYGLEGNWDQWRHNTMDSEEASEYLKRIALGADKTVFNYLDPAASLSKEAWVQMSTLRDAAARAKGKYGFDSTEYSAAWDSLVSYVTSLYNIGINVGR